MHAAGKYLYVNSRRLRTLRRILGGVKFALRFDEGTELRLGLEGPDWIGGETEGQKHLRHLGLQRWPVRLATATPAQLQAWFPAEPARLLANVAMQTLEARERGETVLEGDGHRARIVLRRAGHLGAGGRVASWAFPESLGAREFRRSTYPTFGGEVGMSPDRAWDMLCRLRRAVPPTLTPAASRRILAASRRPGTRPGTTEGALCRGPPARPGAPMVPPPHRLQAAPCLLLSVVTCGRKGTRDGRPVDRARTRPGAGRQPRRHGRR